MALFPEARSNVRALFLDDGSLIGSGLGRADVSNELFDYAVENMSTLPACGIRRLQCAVAVRWTKWVGSVNLRELMLRYFGPATGAWLIENV